MSISINSKWKFSCIIFTVVVCATLVSLGTWSFAESQLDKAVIEAYELRMNGKADEAKAQLEQLLVENPGNAAAHYELARTEYQMGLGTGKLNPEDIQSSMNRAIENDADNVVYAFFAARVSYLRAYIAFQKDEPDAKEKAAQACNFYESALKLKPNYLEAMLYLVEIYGDLPEDKGGDRAKAEQYAKQLEEMDKIYGAKARAILLPDDADYIDYWKTIQKEYEGNVDVLVDLGRAYFFKGKEEDGVNCYEEALRIDPERTLLLLDLGRYYGMTGLRDKKKKETALPLAEKMFKRYLDTGPIPPLKAFATSGLANLKRFMSDKEEAEKLFEEANRIDPFVSRAFGVPSLDLFIPPGEISHNHRYLFTPF
jgi:tetratricopeptide (TPR) repeat protein